MATPLLPVLIIEDSTEDYVALGRAFRKYALHNPVLRCADGDQALEYLTGYGQHPAWPRTLPAIILLDLNMPGTDGRAVLAEVKQNPRLRSIPLIICSTSANRRDVDDCYLMGANSYVTKPIAYAELESKIRLIVEYWLETAELSTAH